jgi:hypothetical protein
VLLACGVVAALAAAGTLVPTRASAASSFAVTTTTDTVLGPGCDDANPGLSLREALCFAAAASPATVSVPAGTYTLVAPLDVEPAMGGSTLVVTGAGAGATTIDAAGGRAFDLDGSLTGGLDVTLERLTITNGVGPAADFGGGAIVAGSGLPGAPDALTLSDCALTANANAPVGSTSAEAAGGAVSMTGGSLTITRCAVDGNTAYGAPGGAVAFMGVDAADSVTIGDSTFSANAATATASSGVVGGGALYVVGITGQPTTTVTGTTFDANTVVSAAAPPAFGSAVYVAGGTATITGSTVLGGQVTGAAGSGGAIWLRFGSVTASRLSGNATVVGGTTTHDAVRGTGVMTTGDWWGCADPRTSTGCQTAPDALTVLPAAVLTAAASPSTAAAGDAVAIAATIGMSDGSAVPAALAAQLAVAPVTWSSGAAGEATVGPDLVATGSLTMGNAPATVTVTVDGASVDASVLLAVPVPPTITADPAAATVDEGDAATFTVEVAGAPAPSVRWQSDATGTWADLTAATGTTLALTGTAALDGVHVRAVATNASGSATSAPALLTVLAAPTVTDPVDVTTAPGAAMTFRTTATGRPAPTLTWQTSPDGLTWTDAGTGPALALTPALADDGLQVRVVATSTIASGPVRVVSGVATLTVIALPTFVSGPPAITSATAGSPVTLSWVVLSSGGTPRWEVSRDGGATWTAPPAGFATSAVTGVAFVQALRGAAPATRTAYVVTFTPTSADDGLIVGLTVTNAAGSTARGTTTLDVPAAPGAPGGSSSTPAAGGTSSGSSDPSTSAGAGGQLSSTGFDAAPLLVAALLALLAGGLVLGVRRRLGRR